ncbi:hypothetical protein M407DRAFT_6982 [Tulasnella calospora MUT 4182]|uniref:Uncharacterized protein n=1 Tax=Tulasnella calospora MUT 4182 TaxID=1051891 RepID=A0A0C3QKN8_9AGAM|nr:hypothetical protein M407DRAFT_6982 [Tulasnella calospora MUT 4182]
MSAGFLLRKLPRTSFAPSLGMEGRPTPHDITMVASRPMPPILVSFVIMPFSYPATTRLISLIRQAPQTPDVRALLDSIELVQSYSEKNCHPGTLASLMSIAEQRFTDATLPRRRWSGLGPEEREAFASAASSSRQQSQTESNDTKQQPRGGPRTAPPKDASAGLSLSERLAMWFITADGPYRLLRAVLHDKMSDDDFEIVNITEPAPVAQITSIAQTAPTTQTDSAAQPYPTFNGVDGLRCHEFIQAVRRCAFNEGKSRDDAWIADRAALCFSGPALMWFEELDDDVQRDWKLLREAFRDRVFSVMRKYLIKLDIAGESVLRVRAKSFANLTENGSPPQANLTKTSGWQYSPQITPLQSQLGGIQKLREGGSAKDSSSTRPSSLLTVDAQTSPLNAKRLNISSWGDPIPAEELGLPTSEDEWISLGRQRRAEMTSSAPWTVGWLFVEAGAPIPLHAIPTGREKGNILFSVRVWRAKGLTLGKHGIHQRDCLITWDSSEFYHEGPYEILVGDSAAVRWVRPNSGALTAVEGGFEVHKENALLITQTERDGNWLPGKGFLGDNYALFGWEMDEERVSLEKFSVLTWSQLTH